MPSQVPSSNPLLQLGAVPSGALNGSILAGHANGNLQTPAFNQVLSQAQSDSAMEGAALPQDGNGLPQSAIQGQVGSEASDASKGEQAELVSNGSPENEVPQDVSVRPPNVESTREQGRTVNILPTTSLTGDTQKSGEDVVAGAADSADALIPQRSQSVETPAPVVNRTAKAPLIGGPVRSAETELSQTRPVVSERADANQPESKLAMSSLVAAGEAPGANNEEVTVARNNAPATESGQRLDAIKTDTVVNAGMIPEEGKGEPQSVAPEAQAILRRSSQLETEERPNPELSKVKAEASSNSELPSFDLDGDVLSLNKVNSSNDAKGALPPTNVLSGQEAGSSNSTQNVTFNPAVSELSKNNPDTRSESEQRASDSMSAFLPEGSRETPNQAALLSGENNVGITTSLGMRQDVNEMAIQSPNAHESGSGDDILQTTVSASQSFVTKAEQGNLSSQQFTVNQPNQPQPQPQVQASTAIPVSPSVRVGQNDSQGRAADLNPAPGSALNASLTDSSNSGLTEKSSGFGIASSHQPTLSTPAPNIQLKVPTGMTPANPGWSQAVSERVVWVAGQQLQSATIQLDPPELGSLQIKLQVSQEQVSVTFTSPHGVVRDAVEQSIPRLREMLAEQGLDLGESFVNDQSADQDRRGSDHSANGEYASGDGYNGQNDTDLLASGNAIGSNLNLVDYYA